MASMSAPSVTVPPGQGKSSPSWILKYRASWTSAAPRSKSQ